MGVLRGKVLFVDVCGFYRVRLVLAALVACLMGLLAASSPLWACGPSLGVYSRASMSELTLRGGTGPLGEPIGFSSPEGIAIDSSGVAGDACNGDVWVGNDADPSFMDEFDSSSKFVPPPLFEGLSVHGLAVEDATCKLYGTGLKDGVAVDNSCFEHVPELTGGECQAFDPMYGAHFVASADPQGVVFVEALNASGEPVMFGGGECTHGNVLELREHCHGYFGGVEDEPTLAVDGSGDLFVGGHELGRKGKVDEFSSGGEFIREFRSDSVPSGFARFSDPSGVAVDPTNGDVVIGAVGEGVVDEFSSLGVFLAQFGGPSKGVGFSKSIKGVGVSGVGDLYVVDAGRDEVFVFGPGAFYPDVVTGGVSGNVGGGEAVLDGVVRDEGKAGSFLRVVDCHFEIVAEAEYKVGAADPFEAGRSVPCVEPGAGEIPVAGGNHRVHGVVSGLVPGVVYRYRLVAGTDPGELGGLADGEGASFAAAAVPRVDSVGVGGVSSSFADFSAGIDPLGVDTSYRFEFVSAAGFDPAAVDPYAGGGSVPVPEGDIGAGDDDVSVVARVGGLSPGTVYHFRVVAVNALGVSVSGDGEFTTLPPSGEGLPDGRAYELVTPANKGDAEDLFGGQNSVNFDLGYASGDGNHFLLLTSAAFGPFPASGEDSYVFSRGATGWSERSVASSGLGVQSAWAEVYDPADFSVVGVHADVGVQAERVLGLVGVPGGPYVEMGASTYGEEEIGVVGASRDLSHVVLESRDHGLPLEEAQAQLAKELDPGSHALYEWTGGRLRLVNVEEAGGSLVSRCGAALGLAASIYQGSTHNAVSSDGSKIFFASPDPYARGGAGCWEGEASGAKTPQLYVRLHGEETIKVSAPDEPGVVVSPGSEQPALFVGASEDGSKVFFATRTELTKDAVKLGTHGLELYEYDLGAPEGSRLVRISGGESGEAEGNIEDVDAVAADGSAVYFTAGGKLTAGAPGGGLYRYDTDTGVTTYIAPRQGYPVETLGSSAWYKPVLNSGLDLALNVLANYYATGNGRFLVFPSTENLAEIPGYKSEGNSELYRYDAEPGPGEKSIECVSCKPGGSPAHFNSEFTRSAVREDNPAGTAPRPISENGEYVFFDTAESLVTRDKNEKIDVYEWHHGVISLITSGQDSADSFFLDSGSYVNASGETIEGGNVFFGTHARLVRQDTDSSGDLYDARIGGGFPESLPVGPCEGDACQNLPPALTDLTPASLAFSGPGNLTSGVGKPVVKSKPKHKKKGKRKVGERRKGKRAVRKARHARRTATRRAGK